MSTESKRGTCDEPPLHLAKICPYGGTPHAQNKSCVGWREVESAPAQPLTIGEPYPTCGRKVLPKMGDGDYSCAQCGMGMKEPCEHWEKMLAESSVAVPPAAPAQPGAGYRISDEYGCNCGVGNCDRSPLTRVKDATRGESMTAEQLYDANEIEGFDKEIASYPDGWFKFANFCMAHVRDEITKEVVSSGGCSQTAPVLQGDSAVGRGAPSGQEITSAEQSEELDAMVRDFCKVGPRPKSEVRSRISAYAAHVREAAQRDACQVCWTSSWAPCPEGTPNAVRTLDSKSTPWMVCGLCAAREQLEAAERKLAEVEKALSLRTIPLLDKLARWFGKQCGWDVARNYEKEIEAVLASLRAESKEG